MIRQFTQGRLFPQPGNRESPGEKLYTCFSEHTLGHCSDSGKTINGLWFLQQLDNPLFPWVGTIDICQQIPGYNENRVGFHTCRTSRLTSVTESAEIKCVGTDFFSGNSVSKELTE